MAAITVPIKVDLPENWVEMIVERLKNDPDGEWMPVIRCKDCRYYDTHGHRCKVWNHGVADDGFCYKGEQE